MVTEPSRTEQAHVSPVPAGLLSDVKAMSYYGVKAWQEGVATLVRGGRQRH
jgi:hypothetical protein